MMKKRYGKGDKMKYAMILLLFLMGCGSNSIIDDGFGKGTKGHVGCRVFDSGQVVCAVTQNGTIYRWIAYPNGEQP
jgi:hypothetical protein